MQKLSTYSFTARKIEFDNRVYREARASIHSP